jgi:hypothetical protein
LKLEKLGDIDTGFAVDIDYLLMVNSIIMRVRVRGS